MQIALATSSGSAISGCMRRGKTDRCGKPSVSTKPGRIVCTRTPCGRSSAVTARENETWACFEAL